MRRIAIKWWQGSTKVHVADMAERRGAPIVLEWNPTFLESHIELSPVKFKKQRGLIECPAQPFNGLPGVLADQVPDGWGKILLKRGLREAGILSDEISPLDALCYIGERGMGALSFEPALDKGESRADGVLKLKDLERSIEPILEGEAADLIEFFLEAGASPHGLRPKILLKERNATFYSGMAPIEGKEWLVKFRGPEDHKDIGKIEYLYCRLAKDAGLRVPEPKLFESGKSFYFASRRFDREKGQRLHLHTLSGLLHASPGNFSVGYDHFARVASFLTKEMAEVEQVFRIATFNAFACNQDDHSRNVAFLMDELGNWKVAPAFDLTFHQTSSQEHKMGIEGRGRLTEEDLSTFGLNIGIKPGKVGEIIAGTKEAISQFPEKAGELGIQKSEIKRIWNAIDRGLLQK